MQRFNLYLAHVLYENYFIFTGLGHTARNKLLNAFIYGCNNTYWIFILRHTTVLRADIETAHEDYVRISFSDIFTL